MNSSKQQQQGVGVRHTWVIYASFMLDGTLVTRHESLGTTMGESRDGLIPRAVNKRGMDVLDGYMTSSDPRCVALNSRIEHYKACNWTLYRDNVAWANSYSRRPLRDGDAGVIEGVLAVEAVEL